LVGTTYLTVEHEGHPDHKKSPNKARMKMADATPVFHHDILEYITLNGRILIAIVILITIAAIDKIKISINGIVLAPIIFHKLK
jgi:hypothetical protein